MLTVVTGDPDVACLRQIASRMIEHADRLAMRGTIDVHTKASLEGVLRGQGAFMLELLARVEAKLAMREL